MNMANVLPCNGSNSGEATQSVADITISPLFRWALIILSYFSGGKIFFVGLSPSLVNSGVVFNEL